MEHIEQPPAKHDKQEFSKGKEGLIFCKICNAVYYKKSWHHNLSAHSDLREDTKVSFALCPACQTIKDKQFEGEINIADVPEKFREDLTNLIRAFTQRAYEKDPMDRLIEIKKTRSGLRVTTTENQLAVKLAKKIRDSFKKASLEISYAKPPLETVHIKIGFSAKKS